MPKSADKLLAMNISQLRERLKNFQFRELFVESLGWDNPAGETSPQESFEINGAQVSCLRIAEISEVPVLRFNRQAYDNYKRDDRKFHKEIKKRCNKHLLLFSDDESFCAFSYFSREEKVRPYEYFKGQSGDYLVSKLAGIHFEIGDEPKITDIGKKLKKAFDTDKITERFYKSFKNNHFQFQKYISGIQSEEEKKWYASLILNRLMFIWFLQKKGFVDNDFDYLQTKLEESKKRGRDRYYSEFLTCLFFEGFAKKPIERSQKAKALLGKIKYLNGGLFVPHAIEQKYEIQNGNEEHKTKIKIQDKAFEETFEIFGQYDWQLEGKQGEPDNEISPDVMGHIFEKYINELQRKSLGAYYTKDEITSYLSLSAIQKSVLEKVNKRINKQGHEFQTIADLLHKLDARLCRLLLTDEDSILNTLTVLDPAAGSGAFLTAAMKELINIYSPIIGKIETLGDRDLKKWLEGFKEKHKSILYGIRKNIILKNLYGVDIMKEAVEVCKLRLFLSLVSSALDREKLEPLPNLDFNILCGNSLIGFLREEAEIKKSGDEGKQESFFGESYQQIKDKYNQMVSRYKNHPLSFAKLKELKNKTNRFLEENNQRLSRALADKCNREAVKYPEILDIQGKKKITKKRAVKPEDFYSKDTERKLNPFHWDFVFNEIIDKGGFDIIITNPPWEKVKIEDREFFHKYDKSIDKKKTSKAAVKRKKTKLLKKNLKVAEDYKKTEEFYLFQRDYFAELYKYQTGEISSADGATKQASADMDTYRLFMERCFELLDERGSLGIVLPSGLCRDDGAIGLRKRLLFKKARIEGLIDFQNQMDKGQGKIFEGVHPQFKFLLLTLQKAEPQDEFPCQFHERDLSALDENQFPKNPKMKQSISEIKKLSPRDWSIIEFKNLKDRKILKKASCFSAIGRRLENSWNPKFYTEFHETNDSHLFKDKKVSADDLPLYKGSAVYQYEWNYDLSYVNRYVNLKSRKIQGKGLPFQNKCYKNYRLVIRTIAGNTNERSLIAAIIPKRCFISNNFLGVYINMPNEISLENHKTNLRAGKQMKQTGQRDFSLDEEKKASHSLKPYMLYSARLKHSEGSKNREGKLNSGRAKRGEKNIIRSTDLHTKPSQNKYMLLLQAFLNSFIVDYFIRQKISAVINQKYIDSLYIPRLAEKDDYFKELVERSAKLTCIGKEFDELADEIGIQRGGVKNQKERWRMQGEIDAIVAQVYGLTLKEFEYILSNFTTGKNQERLKALKKHALQASKKK